MTRARTFLCAAVLASSAGCSGLARVEPARYAAPPADAITFWGHACCFIDAGGVGIVTDPVFQDRLFARKRFVGTPPDEVLRRVNVVLISHAHDDHLSPSSLARFSPDVPVLCPPPAAKFLAEKGIRARAMRPGEEYRVGDVRIVPVPMLHAGTRRGLHPVVDGRAVGWVIVTPAATIFYSGDTEYCSTFADVGWTYAPDVAILNVNGHLPPDDAARAAWATRAPVVIPAHWGAYGYWVFGGNRHPRGEKELRELLGERLRVLPVGGSMALAKGEKSP